jgi:hypothetical protein
MSSSSRLAMADDDWQDLALNHRRIPHGRSKKGGKASGRHGAGVFYPKQALGSYDVYTYFTPANEYIGKITERFRDEFVRARFEIHEFTDQPGGFVGSLVGGNGRFRAAIFLAGSRKLLSSIVRDADEDVNDAEDDVNGGKDARSHGAQSEDEGADADANEVDSEDDEVGEVEGREITASDRFVNDRIQAFAKNSFRQPKFWLQWQGEIEWKDESGSNDTDAKHQTVEGVAKTANAVRERNMGYIIFQDNKCDVFNGTMSCATLGWKDMEISGRKRISSATPPLFVWNDFAIAEDQAEAGNDSGDPSSHEPAS